MIDLQVLGIGKINRYLGRWIRMGDGCAAAGVAVVAVLISGCSEVLDPWSDDTPGVALVSTASSRQVRRSNARSAPRTRGFDRRVVSAQDGSVVHFPLLMQDPYEEQGSEDQQFAWTWEDYVGMPYGLGRFIVNTIGIPVSSAVYPPLINRSSDGVLGDGPHDPQRLAAGGSSVPPDWLEVGVDGEPTQDQPH